MFRAIDRAIERHGFDLVAFVYMPEHVHLLVYPRAAGDVSSLLAAIKRPYSFRARKLMESRNDEQLGKLMIRERPGRRVFRFRQEGSGYDRDATPNGRVKYASSMCSGIRDDEMPPCGCARTIAVRERPRTKDIVLSEYGGVY